MCTSRSSYYINDEWNMQSLTLEFDPADGGLTDIAMSHLFYNFLYKEVNLKVREISLDNKASNITFIKGLGNVMKKSGIQLDIENRHIRYMSDIENLGALSFLRELRLQTGEEGLETDAFSDIGAKKFQYDGCRRKSFL